LESDNVIKNARGFTLIELLIAMIVIAILTAIAYPSYTQYVVRSNRNVAKGDLLELQQWMERNYSLTNSYSVLPDGTAVTDAVLPFAKSPRDSGSYPKYVITFSAGPTALTYTLTSTPETTQPDSLCGTLTLDNVGNKTPTTSGCW
jgi:type IV pilus assembly protein PilE